MTSSQPPPRRQRAEQAVLRSGVAFVSPGKNARWPGYRDLVPALVTGTRLAGWRNSRPGPRRCLSPPRRRPHLVDDLVDHLLERGPRREPEDRVRLCRIGNTALNVVRVGLVEGEPGRRVRPPDLVPDEHRELRHGRAAVGSEVEILPSRAGMFHRSHDAFGEVAAVREMPHLLTCAEYAQRILAGQHPADQIG